MAVLCQTCGVSMASAEATQLPYISPAQTGNWHLQCAHLEAAALSGPAQADPFLHAGYSCMRRKVSDKRAGNATEWP